MPEKSIGLDLTKTTMANEIEEMGRFLIDALIAEGIDAYERHVERRLENSAYVYPLHQITAMAAGEPLSRGFDAKTARAARMILCSYILGLSEVIESFKDLKEYQLHLLYGVIRSEEYSPYYYADLLEVYEQLCQQVWV